MIEVTDKTRCCGCSACANICPVRCITMTADSEGFRYPSADPHACISCGRCDEVCPMNSHVSSQDRTAYAVRVPRYEAESSSGGVFPALAEQVLMEGGAVYGAAFDEEMRLRHIRVKDFAGLQFLRGSKYVQSNIEDAYMLAHEDLSCGRKVLFSGTPCQIAGLHKFLGRNYPGLITVDLACHGVPSPKVWDRYVKEKGPGLVNVIFRDKSFGWRRYHLAYVYKDRTDKIRYDRDPYMQLFLQNLSIRPSCYDCAFRNGGNSSDITLGDFWAVAESVPEMNDGRGVSVVVANTQKGEEIIKGFNTADFLVRNVRYEDAVKSNGGFFTTFDVPVRRSEFFKGLDAVEYMNKYISGFVSTKSCLRDIYERLHKILASIKRRIFS